MARPPHSPPPVWVLGAILGLAAAARLADLDWDQGHAFHPDERAIAFAVERLSLRPLRLNPEFFAYGSLPIYLVAVARGLVSAATGQAKDFAGLILVGRFLSVVAGVAAVLVLHRLARRLYGPPTALLAAGLLAACVLHIQHSRFMTSEALLTLLVLLALGGCLRVQRLGRTRDFLLAGAAVGLALAVKASAAPLLAPYLVASALRLRGDPERQRAAARALGGLAACGVALVAAEPYLVLDFAAVWRQVSEQGDMVRDAGSVPYTVQYMGTIPYVHDLVQMVLWGMGPALGLAVVAAAVARLADYRRRPSEPNLILLAWVVPYVLVTGWFDVKFLRYLLPVYPVLILWAAAWAFGHSRRWPARVAVAGTVTAAIAFLAVSRGPHTVVRASEWVYRNVPAGRTLLVPHWEEGFPLPRPAGQPDRYRILEAPYYEPDTPEKIETLVGRLAEADYVVFPTTRIYGSLGQAPQHRPQTAACLRRLLAGELGFSPVLEVASRPRILGLEALDELADESFTVYDHPKVLVLAKSEPLPPEELRARIEAARPPRSRRSLLLAGRDPGLLGLAWATEPVRAGVLGLAWLAAVVTLLGLSAWGLLGRWLPQRGGYALARVLGLLLFAWAAWLLGHWLPGAFTTPGLTALLVVFVALGAAGFRRAGRPRPRSALLTEGVFWGAFAAFLAARAWNPAIFWGEKPMDFAILNVLSRSAALPAPEPWFAGEALQYTYFGHFLVAALGKLCTLHPAVTFNLAIALVGAAATTSAFAVGCALGVRPHAGGLLTAVLTTLVGNLSGPIEWLRRRTLDFDYFWETSRVIPDTINEYPLWSLLFADLHAHLLALPLSLAFLALAIAWARHPRWTPLRVAVLALVLGGILATSAWSAPTYVLLLPFLLAARVLPGTGRAWWRVLLRGVVFPAAAVPVFAVVLYLPFWLGYRFPPRNLGWERDAYARAAELAQVFGLPAFLAVSFVAALSLRLLREPRRGIGAAAVGLLAAGVAAAALPGAAPLASARTACLLVAGLATGLAWTRRARLRERLVAVVLAYALLVVAGCDVVHVWDRMNTVFKFYLDAWLLLAAGAAGALGLLWRRRRLPAVVHAGWRLATVALLAAAVFTGATAAVAAVRTQRVATPRPSLDGTAYLDEREPGDAAAIEWLNATVRGTPTVAEAWGDAYGDTARVSMHTGLPTVLGWAYHVHQRAQGWPEIEERKQDLARLYDATDAAAVRQVLERYAVEYVYVGSVERRQYGQDTGERVAAAAAGLLAPVYASPEVTILGTRGRLAAAPPVRPAAPRETGPPPGRFRQARGVAVADDGTVYVADFDHHRIQKLGPGLEPLAAWGGEGSARGRFKQPCEVAVFGDEVYVADTWNGRVQVFDRDGGVLRDWGGDFFGPRGLAVGPAGDVYVADTGNHRIRRFDREGREGAGWGRRGSAPGEFLEPVGVAAGPDGQVYVADNGNARLQVFGGDGTFRRAFAVPGWRTEVFSEPKVALDGSGLIWVTVPLAGEVRGYDGEGRLQRTIAGSPPPGGPFSKPLGIAVDPTTGDLLVTDLDDRVVRVPLGRGARATAAPPAKAERRR
jgi:YYY domain-containing protein